MLQVHAQSAAENPAIADALRAGLARIVVLAPLRSGGSADQVQQSIAFGQLCRQVATTGLDDLAEPRVRLLAHGVRRP